METKFNFNSQICTTREQSERLLALGLKKETADTTIHIKKDGHWYVTADPFYEWEDDMNTLPCLEEPDGILPAWSLHRIMSMLPRCVDGGYRLVMSYDHIAYRTTYDDVTTWWRGGGNLYDMIVETIEWLIKEGDLKKEYLV